MTLSQKVKLALTLSTSLFATLAFANPEKCRLSDGININTSEHKLYICENSNIINEFNISIGRNGVDKKISGDAKTPLGLYELESPRKSDRFNTFIPIKYPTPEQIAAGYTGNNVGIHGPFKQFSWKFSWLNLFNSTFDWTLGCVAVTDNEKINLIAQWVKLHPDTKVLII